jgi:hypothetical protein
VEILQGITEGFGPKGQGGKKREESGRKDARGGAETRRDGDIESRENRYAGIEKGRGGGGEMM